MKKVLAFISALLISFSAFGTELSYQAGFSPSLMINTGSKTESAVSPVIYPVDFSIDINIKPAVTIRPSLSFFTYYALWNGKAAAPAEIENRTGTVLSFMLGCTYEYRWLLQEKHFLEAGAGPAFLIRYAILSNNVNSTDSGYTGTAGGDLNEMNSWFWKDANFLYGNLHFTYLYRFNEKVSAGPELSVYIPAGSFVEGTPMNGTIISLGVKARF